VDEKEEIVNSIEKRINTLKDSEERMKVEMKELKSKKMKLEADIKALRENL
jgi:prefoldin subunit 5